MGPGCLWGAMGQAALCCADRSADWGAVEPAPLDPPRGWEFEEEVYFDCDDALAPADRPLGAAAGAKAETTSEAVAAVRGSESDSSETDCNTEGVNRTSCAEDSAAVAPIRMGAPGCADLTEEEEGRYEELCQRLREKPEPEISEHLMEDRRGRLLRFLKGEGWNVESAFRRIHEHAAWWVKYGMDNFAEEDELNESGPIFVCGEDTDGRPILVARPCVHHSRSREESIRIARRCVYTVSRCVQRYRPGVDKHSVIYDCRGLNPRRNMDLVFTREVVDALSNHFPERVHRIVVINLHWTMTACWGAVSPFVDPMTKQRMSFCGSDFKGQVEGLVGPHHPYLEYALKVRGLSRQEAAKVPLPPSAPFVPGWKEAGEGKLLNMPSRQSTAASEGDLVDNIKKPDANILNNSTGSHLHSLGRFMAL